MRVIRCLITAVVVLLSGCATAPTPEERQALAPTGTLRVAFVPVAFYATKDAATGELRGVAVDLGKELARRAGAAFQPVVYSNPAAIIAGGKSGEWDVVFMGISAERAAVIDFSNPFMEIEIGYLVRAGVPIATASEVDKPGIRVGLFEKSSVDAFLSSTLKNATIVRVKTVPEIFASLDSGKADVVAVNKTALFAESQKRPGSRILDGRLLVEPIGMGVPKARSAVASTYVGTFVEAAKAEGLVKAAIDRAGLRGVAVAPSK